jgi:hypothetical protein
MGNGRLNRLLLFFLLIQFSSCSKKESEPAINPLTNTTWSRYAFRSPVDNRDVYYYLCFKTNSSLEEYIRYFKAEPSVDIKLHSYTYNPSDSSATIVIRNEVYVATVYGNHLRLTQGDETLLYLREP